MSPSTAGKGRGSNAPAESGYVAASDIVAFDIYPYNNCGGDTNEKMTCGQFWLNATGVDRLHQWSNRHQAVWTDIETTVISAGTTTGPTPAQTASEVWLSLIHSANGIVYFLDTWEPSFREDGIFKSMPMVTAVTALNAQIKSLAPELNSASLPEPGRRHELEHRGARSTRWSRPRGTSLYVFSAISRAGTATGSFVDRRDDRARPSRPSSARAGRWRSSGGKFSDAFAASAVHIYQVDLTTATCP